MNPTKKGPRKKKGGNNPHGKKEETNLDQLRKRKTPLRLLLRLRLPFFSSPADDPSEPSQLVQLRVIQPYRHSRFLLVSLWTEPARSSNGPKAIPRRSLIEETTKPRTGLLPPPPPPPRRTPSFLQSRLASTPLESNLDRI